MLRFLTAGPETPMTFADGMSSLGDFIAAMLDGWGAVITVMLTASNWILLLGVFAYLFVVVTSSLRSMYKG